MRIRSWRRAIVRSALAGLVAILPIGHTGCVGALAQLLYIVNGGHKLPAKYEGLEDQKVALVVTTLDSMSGASPECDLIAKRLTLELELNVEGIKFVPQDKVEAWIERGGDLQEYADIGRAVEADKVLVIEMAGYRLNEDPTLYKGKADIEVIVYDVETQKEVFRDSKFGFSWPKNAGQHVSETTLHGFEQKFVQVTAEQLARNFYAYNIEEGFGEDARFLSD